MIEVFAGCRADFKIMRQNIFDENPVTRSVNLQNHSTVLVSSQSVRRRGARPARMGSEDKQAKKEKREAKRESLGDSE